MTSRKMASSVVHHHLDLRDISAVPYTSNPFLSLLSDIKLFCNTAMFFPTMVLPWRSRTELDEFYPSLGNLFDGFLHLVLFIAQSAFLLSLPFCFILPLGWFLSYVVAFAILNHIFCYLLNGFKPFTDSTHDISSYPPHLDEKWIFLNGICVG